MSSILVFPGQGSQAVGMGKDLYENNPDARAVFDEVDQRFRRPVGIPQKTHKYFLPYLITLVKKKFPPKKVEMSGVHGFALVQHLPVDPQISVRISCFDLILAYGGIRVDDMAKGFNGFMDTAFPDSLRTLSQDPFPPKGKDWAAAFINSRLIREHDHIRGRIPVFLQFFQSLNR